jgi:hypothetical protein
VLKGDLIFADEEGVPRGHPQDLTLVPHGYFLGCVRIPKLELLSIFQLKYWQKSVKTEQLTKVEFLEGFLLLKSKSVKLIKVWI